MQNTIPVTLVGNNGHETNLGEIDIRVHNGNVLFSGRISRMYSDVLLDDQRYKAELIIQTLPAQPAEHAESDDHIVRGYN